MPKTPTYRKREGRSQALVTLTDSVTKRRRDFWLGEHGTPVSLFPEGSRYAHTNSI